MSPRSTVRPCIAALVGLILLSVTACSTNAHPTTIRAPATTVSTSLVADPVPAPLSAALAGLGRTVEVSDVKSAAYVQTTRSVAVKATGDAGADSDEPVYLLQVVGHVVATVSGPAGPRVITGPTLVLVVDVTTGAVLDAGYGAPVIDVGLIGPARPIDPAVIQQTLAKRPPAPASH